MKPNSVRAALRAAKEACDESEREQIRLQLQLAKTDAETVVLNQMLARIGAKPLTRGRPRRKKNRHELTRSEAMKALERTDWSVVGDVVGEVLERIGKRRVQS